MAKEKISLFHHALANPVRREVISILKKGPLFAGKICEEINNNFVKITQPSMSRHLATLEKGGVVKAVNIGTKRLYSLDRDNIKEMLRETEIFINEG